MSCIHGGDPFTCKRCNTPYKSIEKKTKSTVWRYIKNLDDQTVSDSINNAMGYSKTEQLELT